MVFEIFHSLNGVHVVWADYGFWKKFFKISSKQNWVQKVDSELCANFGYISEPHVNGNQLHDKPSLNGKSVAAQRPLMYDRSSVLSLGESIFDVKGTGLPPNRTPKNEPYSTGLYGLPNACVELVSEHVVRHALKNSSLVTTNRTLAVLATPIRTRLHPKSQFYLPNAIFIRKSNRRPEHGDFFPQGSEMVDLLLGIESELRKSGITSAAYGNNIFPKKAGNKILIRKSQSSESFEIALTEGQKFPECKEIDLINIQLSFDDEKGKIAIVDFEHFSSKKQFSKPLCVISQGKNERIFEVVSPDDVHYVATPQHSLPHADKLSSFSAEINGEVVSGKKLFIQQTANLVNGEFSSFKRDIRRVCRDLR